MAELMLNAEALAAAMREAGLHVEVEDGQIFVSGESREEAQAMVARHIRQSSGTAEVGQVPGGHRLRIDCVVMDALLADEMALGAFLVEVAKKGIADA
jgi:hypothetical protein